jgi:hypothetical protein
MQPWSIPKLGSRVDYGNAMVEFTPYSGTCRNMFVYEVAAEVGVATAQVSRKVSQMERKKRKGARPFDLTP